MKYDEDTIQAAKNYQLEVAERCSDQYEINLQDINIESKAAFLAGVDYAREKQSASMKERLKLVRQSLIHSECWAQGPTTGNYYEDFIVCPGCKGIAILDELLGEK